MADGLKVNELEELESIESDTLFYAVKDNVSYRVNGESLNNAFKTSHIGTSEPTSDMGFDGDIYIQTNSSNSIVAVFGKVNGEWVNFPSGGDGGMENISAGIYLQIPQVYSDDSMQEILRED